MLNMKGCGRSKGGREFGCFGFRCLGFRCLGFWCLGFRGLGFRCLSSRCTVRVNMLHHGYMGCVSTRASEASSGASSQDDQPTPEPPILHFVFLAGGRGERGRGEGEEG